jgi:hypothetical protein
LNIEFSFGDLFFAYPKKKAKKGTAEFSFLKNLPSSRYAKLNSPLAQTVVLHDAPTCCFYTNLKLKLRSQTTFVFGMQFQDLIINTIRRIVNWPTAGEPINKFEFPLRKNFSV